MLRTKEQERALAERLERRMDWLVEITPYIRGGRIVEFGCGSGVLLQTLSKNFPKSLIVGLDISEMMLRLAKARNLRNVAVVRSQAYERVFSERSFDTAIFVQVLHEIYSFAGEGKVGKALKVAFEVLKPDGVLIIRDTLKPKPRWVRLGFKNDEVEGKFRRFAAEFKPRKVKFEASERDVFLDVVDALEFITKYRHPDWEAEMRECHYFFDREQYVAALSNIGFKIKVMREFSPEEEVLQELRRNLELDFEPDYRSIEIIAHKPEGPVNDELQMGFQRGVLAASCQTSQAPPSPTLISHSF